MKNIDTMRAFMIIHAALHTREVVGSSPANPTRTRKSEPDANRRWVRIYCFHTAITCVMSAISEQTKWDALKRCIPFLHLRSISRFGIIGYRIRRMRKIFQHIRKKSAGNRPDYRIRHIVRELFSHHQEKPRFKARCGKMTNTILVSFAVITTGCSPSGK